MRDDIHNSVFVQFHIWDVPGMDRTDRMQLCLLLSLSHGVGDLNLTDRLDGRATDAEKLFLDCTCLIYVIDARVCESLFEIVVDGVRNF